MYLILDNVFCTEFKIILEVYNNLLLSLNNKIYSQGNQGKNKKKYTNIHNVHEARILKD